MLRGSIKLNAPPQYQNSSLKLEILVRTLEPVAERDRDENPRGPDVLRHCATVHSQRSIFVPICDGVLSPTLWYASRTLRQGPRRWSVRFHVRAVQSIFQYADFIVLQLRFCHQWDSIQRSGATTASLVPELDYQLCLHGEGEDM